jgi:hypothetical protein
VNTLPDEDKKAVQCNYRVGTSVCVKGSRAYVLDADFAGARVRRVRVLARSRSGRWIDRWESPRRLHLFRFKTIPQGHPTFGRIGNAALSEEAVRRLNAESAV